MRILSWLIGLAVLGAVVFVILGVTPMGRAPFQAMFAVGPIEKIDFTKMASLRGPAQWLACPGYDMCVELDDRTPIYDNDVNSIKRTWDRMLGELFPQLELVQADDATHQYTYLERRRLFQMPDLLTVQIFPNGETRASVAVFSRSVYPVGDFGSNSSRVVRMMDYLDEHLSLYKR